MKLSAAQVDMLETMAGSRTGKAVGHMPATLRTMRSLEKKGLATLEVSAVGVGVVAITDKGRTVLYNHSHAANPAR